MSKIALWICCAASVVNFALAVMVARDVRVLVRQNEADLRRAEARAKAENRNVKYLSPDW